MPIQSPFDFQMTNCDGSPAKVTELGGKVMMPPRDIAKTGRFSIATDPQGAMFAAFQLVA